MNLSKMLPWLDLYPNREIARLIKERFQDGFYVPPYEGDGCLFVDNLKSAQVNLEVVTAKLAGEVREGRMAGPFVDPPFRSFRIPPLGLFPKKEPNSF